LAPLHAVEGCTTPGRRLCPWGCRAVAPRQDAWDVLTYHGDLLGHGPHTGHQCSGQSHHDLGGVFASGHALAVAVTQPDWRLPADVLERCGLLFEPQWSRPTDCGGVSRGPGAFDPRPTGRGMTGCGEGPPDGAAPHWMSKALLLKASALREQYAFSFWDSTIVSSALHAGASVLYSEDMQAGLVVENQVRIINPFENLQSGGSSG
jgi:hypothetical protein